MAEKLYTRYYIEDIDSGENVAVLDRDIETMEDMKENYIHFVGENDFDNEIFDTDAKFQEWAETVRNADIEGLREIMEGFGCDFVEVDENGNGYVE